MSADPSQRTTVDPIFDKARDKACDKELGEAFLHQDPHTNPEPQDISENPERWPIVRGHVRRRLVHRFPYALLYRVDSDEVVIQATMHLYRRPDYWTDR